MRNAWSLAWVIALVTAGQVGLALSPTLASYAPEALLVLRPQADMLLLTAGVVPPVVAIMIVTPVRIVFHIAYYELGRWGGTSFATRSRLGRWALARLQRRWVLPLLLVAYLLHPATPIDLAMGARATRRHLALSTIVVGVTTSTVAVALAAAGWVAPLSLDLVELLRRNQPRATVVLATIAAITGTVAVWGLVRTAAKARGANAWQVDLETSTRRHYERFPFLQGGTRRIERWTRRLDRLLPDALASGALVLDVGSGSGEATVGASRRGARLVCLDLTSTATGRSRANNPSARVVQGSALALPFADGAFAHAVALGVLHHTASCRHGLAEMARVVRVGGRLVVLLYARWTPYHLAYLATGPLRRRTSPEIVDRAPRWLAGTLRLLVYLSVRQRVDDSQLRCVLADQFWTPRATFHSASEIRRWAAESGLRIVRRRWIPFYSNVFVLEVEDVDSK
ncbi:class I SAM-dependent methyltransferase [Micromonosporaceae bacterium B7E4]